MPVVYQLKRTALILTFLWITQLAICQEEALKAIDKLSTGFYKSQDYDSSIFYAEKLLAEAVKNNSQLYQAWAHYDKGRALYALEKTDEAIKFLYKAMHLSASKAGNELRALACNMLGAITFDEKDYATAKRYFKEEIVIRREIGDTVRIANCLINLSAMHRRLNEVDSSGILLEQVKKMVATSANDKLPGYFYNALGAHFKSVKNLDSAAFCFSESLKIWTQLGDKEEALRPLFNLGLIYHLKGDFKKALIHYLETKKITDELKLFTQKITVYGNLAELYYDLKNYVNSADYFRRYIELKDSLRKNEISDMALKLDKQYQIEKNSIIKNQKAEIGAQTIQIREQNRRIYLSLFAIVLIVAVLFIIVFYVNFKRRSDRKIEEAKKKFFSNVVHEIRTPLSMIQAPLKVLKSGATSADDHKNIELAERNIVRLNDLVTQMLDISKLDSDKYLISETYGDIGIFFDTLVNTFSKIASEKKITLISEFSFQSKLVFFDKDALEKIAGNLLSNAIKYTGEEKQVGISVYTEEIEKGIQLLLNVWDTGIGIPLKDHASIFNRFYRGRQTAEQARGVGIGLSLVKDLVTLLNGSIEFSSRENAGSSFTVTILLKTKEEPVNDPHPTGHESQEEAFRVLIVEDDKEILDFNAGYLEKNNFRVSKSLNGRAALELLEKSLPDLIISDLMMPDMDGLEFLQILKKNPATDHIPVVILSAKSSTGSRIEVLQAGAQVYLSKPFIPEELVSVVRNQLEILRKRKSEFKSLSESPEKNIEEKYVATDPYIQKTVSTILQHMADSEFTVEKLADKMAMNRSHFQRKVKSLTGFSPSEIIKKIRLEKSRELLLTKTNNVTEVAFLTGFSSQSYFTKCFTQHYGISPSHMQNNPPKQA